MKLKNKNIIVTGGTQGLGKAIIQAFLKEGANILTCARTSNDLIKLEKEIENFLQPPQKFITISCDISKNDQVQGMIRKAIDTFGTIDVLVNNAGVYGPLGSIEEIDVEKWIHAIEINLFGVLYTSRAIIPHFKQKKGGKIINISGGGATNPLPKISSYAAAKAAVVRLTETLAEELRDDHIDINAIAPGLLDTRFLDEAIQAGPEKVGQDFYNRMVKQKAQGADPLEKGANLCAYLASEASNGITGKLLAAKWDPWDHLHVYKSELEKSDIYTLRRIVPEDRGKTWN